jgi:monoamine oxidase
VSETTRRDFLRLLALGYLGGLPAANARGEGDDFDCLVLGAGIAGLTAAWQLDQWWGGQKRVAVLEAAGRIGGRIDTRHGVFSTPIEMGAEYVHRPPGSVPLWNYINRFRLPARRIDKMGASKIFYPPSLRPLFSGGRSPTTTALLWNVLDAATFFQNIDSYRGPDRTARQWVQSYEPLLGLDRGLNQDLVAMALTGHMPGTLDDLSIRGFACDRIGSQLKEESEYYLSGGYDSLLKAMAQALDVRLESPVERIDYREPGKVRVTTTSGKVLTARAVVCTFSVGMLRSGQIEFLPGLPPLKRQALTTIKAGSHSKVVLSFRRRFWPEDMAMAHYPWRGRWAGKTYFNLAFNGHSGPPALTALLVGEDAARLDRLSNTEAVRSICADLDVMFPHAAPTAQHLFYRDNEAWLMRKNWAQDRFALGGNSYLSTDFSGLPVTHARSVLARPDLTPGLFWAGEATALSTQPASVHGANESGLRAANEVFAHLKN